MNTNKHGLKTETKKTEYKKNLNKIKKYQYNRKHLYSACTPVAALYRTSIHCITYNINNNPFWLTWLSNVTTVIMISSEAAFFFCHTNTFINLVYFSKLPNIRSRYLGDIWFNCPVSNGFIAILVLCADVWVFLWYAAMYSFVTFLSISAEWHVCFRGKSNGFCLTYHISMKTE